MIVYGYAYRNEDEYMIKSMTGFGRAEVTDEKRTVVVEIRSVSQVLRYKCKNGKAICLC